jgi:hypothetical protein
VVVVKVVAEFRVIGELAGEQAFDGLAPPLSGGGRPVLRLPSVLGADRSEQVVAERRLLCEQATKGRVRNLLPLRLFDQEVAEERVAGEVAPEDGVEQDAVSRLQPRRASRTGGTEGACRSPASSTASRYSTAVARAPLRPRT